MGTIITFPESQRCSDRAGIRNEPATIIILPVIRIERFSDDPTDGFDGPATTGRKRRPGPSRS